VAGIAATIGTYFVGTTANNWIHRFIGTPRTPIMPQAPTVVYLWS